MKHRIILLILASALLHINAFSQGPKNFELFATLHSDYGISEITVSDNIDVILIQGSEEDLRIRAVENTFSRLDMKVEGENLSIAPKKGQLTGERVALYITVDNLKHLTLKGNSFATTRGKLTSRNLLVTIHDNAKMQLGSDGKVVVETPDNYQVLKERQYVSAFALTKI